MLKNPLLTAVQYLKGIGPKRAKTLGQIGINTIEDLLYYFPRRYEDRSNFASIAAMEEGGLYTIRAEVLAKGARRSFLRRGFNITEIAAGDKTGRVSCVWFNQPYLNDYFKVGQGLILYGKIERYAGRLQMVSPEFEIVPEDAAGPQTAAQPQDSSLNVGRIVPVYPLGRGITQRYFRQAVKQALDGYLPRINDFLPYHIRSKGNFLNLARSLLNIHFPESLSLREEAHRRLSFEEFFIFQLPLALRKLRRQEQAGISHRTEGGLPRDFISGLPFKLTPAQEKVIREIKADMAKPEAMHRLLQGDVGSGKTVVAAVACLIAVGGGYQAAFMAPTEILAKQHYRNLKSQISNLNPSTTCFDSAQYPSKHPESVEGLRVDGERSRTIKYKGRAVNIGLLTSGAGKKEKEKLCRQIKEGRIDLVIGTHALLEEEVRFQKLGLVVIDEQHKFGVGQRALLPRKGGNPDVLIMTATPIPRTLAITLYGDLDVSVIDQLPAGRVPVKTLCFSASQKPQAYVIAKRELLKGNQAYIIYPVIDESYALDIIGAKKMYDELKRGEFKEFKVGLIHGRLKQKEQDEVMRGFKERELDVLVATTVLEVGIDIPRATCLIVENAERFGLSQLHQLRGRVGRDKYESFCLLISGSGAKETGSRLEAMAKYSDGFRIAEEDLRIRGPGEFFGRRQHGLTELKVANPLTQIRLLKLAREEAIRLLNADPCLQARPNSLLKEKLLQRFPEYEKLMVVG